MRRRQDTEARSLMARSVVCWKERLIRKRDAETSDVSNKLYPTCKKVLKDFRLLLRVMLTSRFLKHELKNRQRLYRAVESLLQEMELPIRFVDALAVLLRPRQCDEQVHRTYELALYVFERLNHSSIRAFF